MALFGRKSLRQFACNDALWATFERMAGDQEKSVDDLVNDALESYASKYRDRVRAAIESDIAKLGVVIEAPSPRPEIHDVNGATVDYSTTSR